ncbi:hypothetical protein AAMO2058_000712000 [Amorphochlora amoebiformis]
MKKLRVEGRRPLCAKREDTKSRPVVCFLCLGSRGDVYAAASVALTVLDEAGSTTTTGSTRKNCARANPTRSVDRFSVKRPREEGGCCVRFVTHGKFSGDLEKMFTTEGYGKNRAEVIGIDAPVAVSQEHNIMREMFSLYNAVEKHPKPSVVVYNLYTLSGYHIAEALNLPGVVAAAGVIPPEVTGTAQKATRRIVKAMTGLGFTLSRSSEGGKEVSEMDIEHWMTPLWLDHYQDFRKNDPKPFPKTWINYLKSSLPRPTPVFYGVSSLVYPLPGYLPSHIRTVGFWLVPESIPFETKQLDDTLNLIQKHRALGNSIVYFGLGSMGTMETTKDTAAKIVSDIRGRKSSNSSQFRGICMIFQDPATYLPHRVLFPRCDVIVHHGGAQTVGQAIRAGKAQIIIPFCYDQFLWGATVERLGIGRTLDAKKGSLQSELEACIRYLLNEKRSKTIKRRCEEISNSSDFDGLLQIKGEIIRLSKYKSFPR